MHPACGNRVRSYRRTHRRCGRQNEPVIIKCAGHATGIAGYNTTCMENHKNSIYHLKNATNDVLLNNAPVQHIQQVTQHAVDPLRRKVAAEGIDSAMVRTISAREWTAEAALTKMLLENEAKEKAAADKEAAAAARVQKAEENEKRKAEENQAAAARKQLRAEKKQAAEDAKAAASAAKPAKAAKRQHNTPPIE